MWSMSGWRPITGLGETAPIPGEQVFKCMGCLASRRRSAATSLRRTTFECTARRHQ